jgi:hypothetical protein
MFQPLSELVAPVVSDTTFGLDLTMRSEGLIKMAATQTLSEDSGKF